MIKRWWGGSSSIDHAYTGPMTIISAKSVLDDDGNELVTYLVRLDDASLHAIRKIVREELATRLKNEQR